jgi:hypothetical protein
MCRFLLFLFLLSAQFTARSQRVYFIYLQTESGQSFFVKLENKIYSSGSSGYLILSKLKDTSYTFSVGFPGNKWPEQFFTIPVNKKDHGFLIKNFGENGWGLFNLQSLAVLMPEKTLSKNPDSARPDNREVSDFTNMLSKATNDPTLKEKPVQPSKEEKKNEPAVPETSLKPEPQKQETDSVEANPANTAPVATVNTDVKEPVKNTVTAGQPASSTSENVSSVDKPEQGQLQPDSKPVIEEFKKSLVKRKSESSTTDGFGLIFTDEYADGSIDTIKIVIPNSAKSAGFPVIKEEPKEEKSFLDITSANSDSVTKQEKNTGTAENSVPAAVIKNNCPAIADDNDFLKLRKKMAAETGDDNMINEAKKYFKTKCFTVLQLKNLSTLFLSDEGKYRFFDVGYRYVSDIGNFQSLQLELKEIYYINRFKTMLRL